MRRDFHGETQFEGHVESWHAPGQLNPAEIMKRVTAGADQFEDPVEALSRAWKLERCPRTQAEAAKTGNERQEQVLVRDVQEGVIRRDKAW